MKHHTCVEVITHFLPRADSVSNVSEDVRTSIEGKLREDYDVLLKEVRELRVGLQNTFTF